MCFSALVDQLPYQNGTVGFRQSATPLPCYYATFLAFEIGTVAKTHNKSPTHSVDNSAHGTQKALKTRQTSCLSSKISLCERNWFGQASESVLEYRGTYRYTRCNGDTSSEQVGVYVRTYVRTRVLRTYVRTYVYQYGSIAPTKNSRVKETNWRPS